MPALNCICGVSLNVNSIAEGEVFRCPRCGQPIGEERGAQPTAADATPQASAGESENDALLRFQRQFENIVNHSSDLLFTKARKSLLPPSPGVLSAYRHKDEFYPCVNWANEAFKRFALLTAPADFFVAFCSRTGRAALSGQAVQVYDLRRSSAGDPDMQKRRIVPDSVIVCAGEGCRTDLTHIPKLRACPQCGSASATLVFRLRPQPAGNIPLREDGIFWGVDIEDDGIAFRHEKPNRKFRFEELGIINVEFWKAGTALMKTIFAGKLHIILYDRDAKPLYETYSREKFEDVTFRSWVLTAAAKAGAVGIHDTSYADRWNP